MSDTKTIYSLFVTNISIYIYLYNISFCTLYYMCKSVVSHLYLPGTEKRISFITIPRYCHGRIKDPRQDAIHSNALRL